MGEPRVVVEQQGHVLRMELNRPEKYNAFDVASYRELAQAYGRLDREPELRCGLVCGRGEHFTAGLELDQWAGELAQGRFPPLPEGACEPFGLDPARRVRKPVVFAVHGICFTVAIELMLAGDVRVAAQGARFGQIEVRRGIYAVGGATLRMVQEFGWGNAQRYLLTGEEFGADEALRIGLVQEVVPREEVQARGLAIAERIARQAPLAVQASLQSSRIFAEHGAGAALARLLPDLQALMGSDDVQEGVRSFLERREAHFTGR
jgi:enoyl-CoA hydratase